MFFYVSEDTQESSLHLFLESLVNP